MVKEQFDTEQRKMIKEKHNYADTVHGAKKLAEEKAKELKTIQVNFLKNFHYFIRRWLKSFEK